MKKLIVYYSRSGFTKKIAHELKEKLNCDIEEIKDKKSRSGILGYLCGGKDAAFNIKADIHEMKYSTSNYDLIIIGSPVWAGKMAPAVRTYIIENKDKIKKLATFLTMGSTGGNTALKCIEELTKKDEIQSIILKTGEIEKNIHIDKIDEFVSRLKLIK